MSLFALQRLLTISLALLVWNCAAQGTLYSVIQSRPELTNFTIALQLTGLDAVLDDPTREFTVLAPSDNVIDIYDSVFYTYMSVDGWVHHLKTNLQLMIVPNQTLTSDMIFDQQTTELPTLNGTLAVNQPFQDINFVGIETPNVDSASNGILHIMNGVMKPYWREYDLRDVNVHEELRDGLSPILDRLEVLDDPLRALVPTGTSFVAARDDAYEDEGYTDIVQELQDPQNVEFQQEVFLYNLIDFNIYEQDIERGFQLLVRPRNFNSTAHMWITKDFDNGLLRFNDAVMDRQALADNGVTQIVSKPLVPPGMGMLLEYSADYTTINVRDMVQYLKSSEWNLRDLSKSIGLEGGGLNMFCPLQTGFGAAFDIEVAVRLSTLEWQRHLWDFLKHTMVEPARTTEEWYGLVQSAPEGTLTVEMLSGFNTTLTLDDDGELRIDGARFLKPYDMKGVDGYIHLVEQVPLPPSVLYTIYNQTQQDPDMSTVARLMEVTQMGVFIDNLLPATFFSPINDAWDVIIPTLEIEDVLKNHMFELLWFDDSLANMDGQQITSVNGKQWNIQVMDDPNGEPLYYAPDRAPVKIYISNADGPLGLTNCSLTHGWGQTNILASTGIIHHIDCLFLDFNYTRVDPNAPTFAPIAVPSPTMYPSLEASLAGSLDSSFDPSFDATVDPSELLDVAVLAQEDGPVEPESVASTSNLRRRDDGIF